MGLCHYGYCQRGLYVNETCEPSVGQNWWWIDRKYFVEIVSGVLYFAVDASPYVKRMEIVIDGGALSI